MVDPERNFQEPPERPSIVDRTYPPTACEMFMLWGGLVEKWRGFVGVESAGNGGPDRVSLMIPKDATAEDASTAICYCVDRLPKGKLPATLTDLPGFRRFVTAANELGRATRALKPFFRRHGEALENASTLAEELERSRPLPTLETDKRMWFVRRQNEAIESRIANGVLRGEEDLAERRAFWSHKLRGVRTPEGRHRFERAIDNSLTRDRSPGLELDLLNAVQREHRREDVLVALGPIRRNQGADPISLCHRWQELVGLGQRFFARCRGDAQPIHLERPFHVTSANETATVEMQWGDELRQVTAALRRPADDEGFEPAVRLCVTEMTQDMEAILAGEPRDFRHTVKRVATLVADLLDRVRRSPRRVLDRFHADLVVLRDSVQQLSILLRGYESTGHGLMILDQYVINVGEGHESQGPGRHEDIAWQTTVRTMRAHLDDALAIWDSRDAYYSLPILRHEFARIGKANAKVSPLHENSQHELLLRVTRVLLEPEANGVVPQYAIDAVGMRAAFVRRRLAETLKETGWPHENSLEFEREYAELLGTSESLAVAGPGASRIQAPVAGAPESNKPKQGIRVSYREAIGGRPDLHLPRTPKTTLATWCKSPQTAADLGVNHKGKVSAQQPLVEGLLRLHAQKSQRRQPPRSRQK